MFKFTCFLESLCTLNRCVSRVGGMDLSFIKGNEKVACAALVICELPDLEVVYEDIRMVSVTVPYIPGMPYVNF
jgi:deoxyinosine 3'endonuclease (endonuclease V)